LAISATSGTYGKSISGSNGPFVGSSGTSGWQIGMVGSSGTSGSSSLFCPKCGSKKIEFIQTIKESTIKSILKLFKKNNNYTNKYNCNDCGLKSNYNDLLKSEEESINTKRHKILEEILEGEIEELEILVY